MARAWSLATQAAYLDDKSNIELARAGYELTEQHRARRRDQAARYGKQADSLRGQVKAIEQAQVELVKQRDQLEQRMREW